MKTVILSSNREKGQFFFTSVAIAWVLLLLMVASCKKYDPDLLNQESLKSKEETSGDELHTLPSPQGMQIIYFGPMKFSRNSGAPITERVIIENSSFGCFDGNFILKIKNGIDKKTRVSSAVVIINGNIIVGPSDFSKNVSFITKQLKGLTAESVLEVKLNSTPGSFLEIWIEGTINTIIPSFVQIGPLLQNSIAPGLPAVSENGITGIWSPDAINTSLAGSFAFTFTPAANQCATSFKMVIEILSKGTISDVDGNLYNVVKIGDQWWMAENLKTTKYSNGDLIGTTTPATLDICNETLPKYQWAPEGNELNVAAYGRLYTGYVITDSRNVCPSGWHVPADSEWTTLSDYLINKGFGFEGSGSDIAKSMASKYGWINDPVPGNIGNDQSSNNSSGFSALPAGGRNCGGSFRLLGDYSSWWSSSIDNLTSKMWFRSFYSSSNSLIRTNDIMKSAVSVRCLKDY